ncbi:hypothetical protein CELL_02662 [Cellulomonas sp. T2.31MG-18]|uniref:LapA family protein n=1 Tax=Cellulomonas sp. T2.31MG-18 TaxID=3157619 RepID=UPI0035EB0507
MPSQNTTPGTSPSLPDDRRAASRPAPIQGTTTPAPRRSRIGAAWVGLVVGALVLVALIVFMLQNTAPVQVTFLGMRGTAPLALTLLIAGIGVGVVALVVGSIRIGQLRHRLGVEGRVREAGRR